MWLSAAASWSARGLSRSRLAKLVAGPNVVSFRIAFPPRAAEDCRTPGPFGVHQLGGFPPVGDPPRSLGGYGGERDSVPECASPLALSTREPRGGPNAASFRIPFPGRAAEDCRTPGPFGVHQLGAFHPSGIRLVPSAATGRSARVLSRSRLANLVGNQPTRSSASRSQQERQRTAALRDRSESISWGLSTRPGDPPRSFGGYRDERGSVLECASPLALSTREPRAGPTDSFFRIPFPARAAEDCRTPRPFGVHQLGGFPPVPGIRLVPWAATGMSAAASWSARVLSRSRLANIVAGPNAVFFRIGFPTRAAEDCRTPRPFGVHQLGAFHQSRGSASFPRRLRGGARFPPS